MTIKTFNSKLKILHPLVNKRLTFDRFTSINIIILVFQCTDNKIMIFRNKYKGADRDILFAHRMTPHLKSKLPYLL